MLRIAALLLLCGSTAFAQTVTYWFQQWQKKPGVEQAQEYFMLPGPGIGFSVVSNRILISSTGTNISISTNAIYAQMATNGPDGNPLLTANQPITLTGDVTGGPAATSIATTLKNTGTAGTYTKTTFDAQGRETSGTAAVLASADYANQGTATTVLHGNAAGNPSWAAVDLANDVTGNLGISHLNGGTGAGVGTFWRGDGTWAAAGGGSPQTNISYLAVTNAPWQWGCANLSNLCSYVNFTGDGLINQAGANALGNNGGVSIGTAANGSLAGAAVGTNAIGWFYGAAVGVNSKGTNNGAAFGNTSIGNDWGVGIGAFSDGHGIGNVAIGGTRWTGSPENPAVIPNGWYDTVELGRGTATLQNGLNLWGKPFVRSNAMDMYIGSITCTNSITNLNGAIYIPTTSSATVGTIQQNGVNIFSTYGTGNTFIGNPGGASANFTLSGTYNVGIGRYTFNKLTCGNNNVAIGNIALSLLEGGNENMGLGSGTLASVKSGSDNMAIGIRSMNKTTASFGVAVGAHSFANNTYAVGDVGIGYGAGYTTTSGGYNTFIGYNSGSHASQKVNPDNSMALGNGTYTTNSDQVVIGNTSVTQQCLNGAVLISRRCMATNFLTSHVKWIDVPMNYSATTLGPNAPSLHAVSTGSVIQGLSFDDNDIMYAQAQFQHNVAVTNSDFPSFYFEPHVHFTCVGSGLPDATHSNVTWRCEWEFANIGETWTKGTNTVTTMIVANDTHYMAELGHITNNVGNHLSAIFRCRLMRPASALIEYSTGNDVVLDGFDIHIPVGNQNAIGSSTDNAP